MYVFFCKIAVQKASTTSVLYIFYIYVKVCEYSKMLPFKAFQMAETNGSVMEWSFDLCPSCSELVVVFYPSFIYLVCWCKRFQLITKNEAWFGIFGDFFFFP